MRSCCWSDRHDITRNATVSGAEGGCQAETGSAAAMAAAGIVSILGGTPRQSLDAAATALKNVMGLVCDPIAGLVESPCQKRNALGTANALISAEMTLAGIPSVIPFDEVVDAMYKVGKRMPMELRENRPRRASPTPRRAVPSVNRIYQ
jgi:L-serine dehydratase